MPIESGEGGTVFTGKEVHLFQWAATAHALALEVKTGMKFSRGSVMQRANQISGSGKRTKKGALKDLVAHIKKEFPKWEPGASIKEAMK